MFERLPKRRLVIESVDVYCLFEQRWLRPYPVPQLNCCELMEPSQYGDYWDVFLFL